jgi:hypothetical protein
MFAKSFKKRTKEIKSIAGWGVEISSLVHKKAEFCPAFFINL